MKLFSFKSLTVLVLAVLCLCLMIGDASAGCGGKLFGKLRSRRAGASSCGQSQAVAVQSATVPQVVVASYPQPMPAAIRTTGVVTCPYQQGPVNIVPTGSPFTPQIQKVK